MATIRFPAICKKCNRVFCIIPNSAPTVNGKFSQAIKEQIVPKKCIDKKCQGDAFVPEGVYEWENDQIHLISGSDYTKDVFQKLIDAAKNVLTVFRYMDKEFIEAFKNEGLLRVCLMAKYHTIPDIRKDDTEGIQTSKIKGHGELTGEQAKSILGVEVKSIKITPDSKTTFIHNITLPQAYIFCTSTERNSKLMKRFNCNDYFTIYDVPKFKTALQRAISEHYEIQYSLDKEVEYKSDKNINYNIAQLVEKNGTILRNDAMSYFRKAKNYSIESEYRFVNIVNSDNPLNELYVKLTNEEIKASCTFNADGEQISSTTSKIGRNELCHCGSKIKYKYCHGKLQ